MNHNNTNFALSFNNIQSIPLEKYEKNFTFIVDGEPYFAPRFVADILSPQIRQLHFFDDSVQDFYINTNDSEHKNLNGNNYFSEFLQMCNFEEHQLDDTQRELFSTYFLKLCNIKEYFRLTGTQFDTESPAESIEHLVKIEKVLLDNSDEIAYHQANIEKLISNISKKFYELSIEELKKLPFEYLYEIISSDQLVVRDEDWLFDIVLDLYENDSSYSKLFSMILFTNLSTASIDKFIKRFSLDDIDQEIWHSFCKRLLPDENDRDISGRYLQSFKEYTLETGHEFEGIMNHLTKETGGNIHDNGTIEITSNSIDSNFYPKNLVDYKSTNFYQSKEEPNPFICFDFKDRGIQLSGYSIGSGSNDQNDQHLRNWVVEVSNDGQNYEEVDRHSDYSGLNGSRLIKTFNVKKTNEEFYRFIRLRSTGYSWDSYPNSNRYRIYFYYIEFFGKLKDKEN